MIGIMYRHGLLYETLLRFTDPGNIVPKKIAELITGESVLELGCGTARLREFIPKETEYLGIELNENFIEYAKKKGRERVIKGDILKDNLPKADAVLLTDVLHHVNPSHEKLLRRAKDCAKERVIVCEPYDRPGTLAGRLTDIFGKILDKDGFNECTSWMTKDKVIEFMEKHGAEEIMQVNSHIIGIIPCKPSRT
jgi:SAM-dependent methyltransferase